MIQKGLVLGVLILLIITSSSPNINSDIIEENINYKNYKYQTTSSIINESLLDLEFIRSIAENLSNIIFTEYNESAGELAKGRAFGTLGEHKAAEIIFENMTILGLNPKKETIINTEEKPNLASKIEINERGLSVMNITTRSVTPVLDCFISARSNLTDFNIYLKEFQSQYPIKGLLIKLLTKIILKVDGYFDRKYNIYDFERLNHNFSYKSLQVKTKPFNYSFAKDIVHCFKKEEPFVYIYLDGSFTSWPFPLEETVFKGFVYNNLFKIIDFLKINHGITEQLILALFHPKCVGLIKVDSNNDTYNMGTGWAPLPVISVNKTIGWDIYDNPDNYNIDFYLNQSWNESVLSYNIIGQLNGTRSNETIIVCSLYDSWWCQGTGDAAIGMAMVLAIAKYFKDHGIIPKCNVKFIAFGGEEYGLKGAYYYESQHREENIRCVIDLNQLGFTALMPENLKLQIWTNNETLNTTLKDIAEETNYTERTGTGFQTRYIWDGGPSNTKAFSINNEKRERFCNTVLFVKTGYHVPGPDWLNHHRDGLNHMEGDVFEYFNDIDTSVTGEMVWNITNFLINSI